MSQNKTIALAGLVLLGLTPAAPASTLLSGSGAQLSLSTTTGGIDAQNPDGVALSLAAADQGSLTGVTALGTLLLGVFEPPAASTTPPPGDNAAGHWSLFE